MKLILSLIVLISGQTAFAASTILVREEEGLTCCTVSREWTLEQNGPSVIAPWGGFELGPFEFSLAYSGNSFLLTAQTDNDVYLRPDITYLAVYPGDEPPVCEECGDDPNVMGYIGIYRFPAIAGGSVSVLVVPEVSTFVLFAAGLLGLTFVRRLGPAQPEVR